MRKWLSLLVVLAFALPAYAFNVKIHGDFRQSFGYDSEAGFRAAYVTHSKGIYVNKDVIEKKDLYDAHDDDFNANAKYRMWFVASDDAKKMIGVWAMEVGSIWYGDPNKGGKYSGDGNNYETRWLYLDFQNPFVSFKNRFRAGLQGVGFNYWVWSETAMGVKMYGDVGPVGYELAWFRPYSESKRDQEGRHDAFFAKLSYKISGVKLTAFGLYLRADSVGSSINKSGNYDDERYYVGLEAKGKVGPLGVWANAIYLGGELYDKVADKDYDRSAYFLHADVTYDFTDMFGVRVAGIYASGDDDANDDNLDNWDAIDIDNGKYSTIFWEGVALDDGEFSDAPYFYDKGLMMGYIAALFRPTKQVKGELGVSYIATAEDLEWIDHTGKKQSDDYLGTSIDLRLQYEWMKGVYFQFTAGYLIAGDAMDLYDPKDDADDIFRTAMRVKFKF